MRYRTATPPSSGSIWMSLALERMPSERIRSTIRTTGRWDASSAEIISSSVLISSSSCSISVDDSIPSSS